MKPVPRCARDGGGSHFSAQGLAIPWVVMAWGEGAARRAAAGGPLSRPEHFGMERTITYGAAGEIR